MSYAVKEIYHTLQGEGFHAGRAAVFLRFSGCNLWSGREADRGEARCQFCDTDFFGIDGERGGKYASAEDLSTSCLQCWKAAVPDGTSQPMIVCTGGEPLLQVDQTLIEALHNIGFYVAVETNGTRVPPPGIDWTCLSPKAGTDLVIREGNELKLVFPQSGLMPADLADLKFEHRFLQPMDGRHMAVNIRRAIEYCLANPPWRLSLQHHKLWGVR